jgi:hypothetical protein
LTKGGTDGCHCCWAFTEAIAAGLLLLPLLQGLIYTAGLMYNILHFFNIPVHVQEVRATAAAAAAAAALQHSSKSSSRRTASVSGGTPAQQQQQLQIRHISIHSTTSPPLNCQGVQC